MIREINIRDQVLPFLLWIATICFVVIRMSHCWRIIRRLLTKRVVDGKRMLGNRTIRITIGRPIIVGVVKEANKFSFI